MQKVDFIAQNFQARNFRNLMNGVGTHKSIMF